jgi:ParB family transcriptional regulator, chromosome partitioning protein
MTKDRKTLSDTVMKRFITNPNISQSDLPSTKVAINTIKLPVKQQPRRYFDPERMAQLVASVKEHGILEPILVRPLGDGNYELVAGERRLRAANEVGLIQIPVVAQAFSDKEALQVSLIENLQRDDLNPVEETEAVLDLLSISLGISSDEVKSVIYQVANSKNRGHELKGNVSLQIELIEQCLSDLGRFNVESLRSSRLPLLNLPTNILIALREGKLEYTKARTIARVKDEKSQNEILEQAILENLSLNEIKIRIRKLFQDTKTVKTPEKIVLSRFAEISKQFKGSKVWNERKKSDRIMKLLDELEKLARDN